MVIRILSKSASFNGVEYNTDKIKNEKGELMLTSGFGSLQGIANLRPEDYKNYLKAVSARNSRIRLPQLHAAISAKGREYDKQQLTAIAVQWLAEMGYANQPYLVVFHKDTNNNHVHIVSTRVGRDGKKIKDSFENIRAIASLSKVMGQDEKFSTRKAIEKAFTYKVSTNAQFKMILEEQGLILKESGDLLQVIKFGKVQENIPLSRISGHLIKDSNDKARVRQLKAIFYKYAAQHDTALKPVTIPLPGNFNKLGHGHTSEFAAHLKTQFGISLIFHAKGEQTPYGYTVIDHGHKAVYKGGDIIPLKDLLQIGQEGQFDHDANYDRDLAIEPGPFAIDQDTLNYYLALLNAAINNYSDPNQGLHHLGITLITKGNGLLLEDPQAQVAVPLKDFLEPESYDALHRNYAQDQEPGRKINHQYLPIIGINIASDVDDDQIHGPRRKRKRKARTNTR